jgi:hypothetical protein
MYRQMHKIIYRNCPCIQPEFSVRIYIGLSLQENQVDHYKERKMLF